MFLAGVQDGQHGRRHTRKSGIVVACDVIEHFEYSRAEFSRLLSYVVPDGLLVCSTNIYDGGDLSRHRHIHYRGHASYYSPAALRSIARRNHVLLDSGCRTRRRDMWDPETLRAHEPVADRLGGGRRLLRKPHVRPVRGPDPA
jgi:hypothetical protein